jgi:segregation and condensation protein A
VPRGAAGREGRPEVAPVYHPALPDIWRVADALGRIRVVLDEHPDGAPVTAFLPAISVEEPDRPLKARAAVASTLLAGLELARDAQASMEQEEAFGHILLPATLQDASVGS